MVKVYHTLYASREFNGIKVHGWNIHDTDEGYACKANLVGFEARDGHDEASWGIQSDGSFVQKIEG